jgi:hypothetical protein
VVPPLLGGVPVGRIAPHALSGLAQLRTVSFPPSLRSVGAFALHNCPGLEEVALHDGITDYYNGVLRQDVRLQRVRLTISENNYTVMRDILSDSDAKLEFLLVYPEGEAHLLFPGYDYAFAENTMARTIQFSISGSGMVYRECVRRRGISFREYDRLFPRVIPDDPHAAVQIAADRLLYPHDLAPVHAQAYEDYLKANIGDVLLQFVSALAAEPDGTGAEETWQRLRLVADRGMYSGTNMLKVADGGNGYIVAKSLLKSTAAERAWATGPEDWESLGKDLKYKSRTVTRKAVDGSGNPVLDCRGEQRKYEEKVVVYWSRSFYERQRHENKSFLDFVEELRKNPNGFRVTKANYRSLRKFLKKKVVNTETGEELDGTKLRAMVDDEKLDAFKDLMGYYQIVSSETGMPSSEIIEKYHGLTQIEDQFREMKGTLRTRPVYVSTREHIKAHLLVCFIALTMMRLIQRKARAALPGDKTKKDVKWSYGIPGARIARALREWKACELPDEEHYMMLDADGEDIGTILRAFGVDVAPQAYTKGELTRLKSSISVF